MVFEVRLLEEADVADYVRIYYAAFQHGISAFLNPDPADAAPLLSARMLHVLREDPTVRLLKVVDTQDDDKTVACAKWHRYGEERSAGDVAKAAAPPPAPESAQPDAWKDLFGYLEELRLKYLGVQKCWFLSILITDPEYERRGAGTMLMRWACERADAEGLPAYLESGSVAKSLYERCGFTTLEAREFDLAKYGGEGKDVITAMWLSVKRASE